LLVGNFLRPWKRGDRELSRRRLSGADDFSTEKIFGNRTGGDSSYSSADAMSAAPDNTNLAHGSSIAAYQTPKIR